MKPGEGRETIAPLANPYAVSFQSVVLRTLSCPRTRSLAAQ